MNANNSQLHPFEELYSKTRLSAHEMKEKLIPKDFIPILEVHLVEHCNLNCSGCSHFSNLAEKQFTDINVFEKDLKLLSELSQQKIERLHLMGGEPLLHPQTIDFMKISRKYFPEITIYFVTNGVLFANTKDEFWEACKEYDIEVRPTKYPLNINYEIGEEKAKEHNVKYIYYNEAKQVKTSLHFALDLEGKQKPVHSFLNCFITPCNLLKNGKIYTCSIAGNLEHFNKFFGKNIPELDSSYIELEKVKDFSEILTFLATPISLCAYCNSAARTRQPFALSKKDIHEWVL